MPFVQMENIASFLKAASRIGVPDDELFETVDLFDKTDPIQVWTTIRSYSRYANKKNPSIPVLGPRLTEKQSSPRNFKPTAIPAWNTHQYGYMGGANQSTEGVVVGKRREITTAPKPNTAPKTPNLFVPTRPPKPIKLSAKKVNPAAKPANVFGVTEDDDNDNDNDSNQGSGKHSTSVKNNKSISVNKQLMAYSIQSQSQVKKYEKAAEEDPSIFAYDEVYDSMKSVEREKKQQLKEQESKGVSYFLFLLSSIFELTNYLLTIFFIKKAKIYG